MKLTIERAALLKALAHVQSVVERRNTIPILSNVLLAAEDGELALTATDMDLAIVEAVPGAGRPRRPHHGAGRTRCTRSCASCPTAPGRARPCRRRCRADAARRPLQLQPVVLPAEDFPSMAAGELPHRFSLSAPTLRELVDRTRFAISHRGDPLLPERHLSARAPRATAAQVLRAVATDGHRLARVEVPLPEGAAGMPGVIIPRKTVNELRKLIDEADRRDRGRAVRDQASASHAGAVPLTTKLIDGTFPEYERVIPRGNDKCCGSTRRISPRPSAASSTISAEKSRPVKLSLDRDQLVLSAAARAGHGEEELEPIT